MWATASLPSSVVTRVGSMVGSWFGDHLDGVAGAILEADRAPRAPSEVEAIAFAGTELNDRILGARPITAVALETVAAREAAFGFVKRLCLAQAPGNLLETEAPACRVDD